MIVLSAIVMQPLQAVIGDVMIKIRTDFIKTLEDYTGLEIYYSSIRPAFFGSINVRELKFVNNNTVLFSISKIQIDFSLYQLLFEKKIEIHTVTIDKPELNLDTQRDKQALEYLSSLFNNNNNIDILEIFFPQGVEYQIRRGSLKFNNNEITAAAQDINFNLNKNAGELFFNGNFFAEIKYSSFFNTIMILNTSAGISGAGSSDLNEGQVEISVSYITCLLQDEVNKEATFFNSPLNSGRPREMFTIIPFEAAVSYKDSVFNISNLMENYSVEYVFNYDINSGLFYTNAFFNDFMLTEKIVFSDQWMDSDYFLDMRINGTSAFSYKNDTNAFEYFIDLNGLNMRKNLSGGASLVDAFVIEASGDNKYIKINEASFSSSNIKGLDYTLISQQGFELPKGGFFYGQAGFSGNISFEKTVFNLPFSPQGTLLFNDFSLTGNKGMTSAMDISANSHEIIVLSEKTLIAGTELNDLYITLSPYENEIEIKVSCYAGDEGAILLDAFVSGNQSQVESSILMNSMTIYDILEFFKPFTDIIEVPDIYASLLQDSMIDADIFLSTDFNNIVYYVPSLLFSAAGINGELSISGSGKQFNISESIINISDNEVIFSAGIDFANPSDLLFSVYASFLEYSWNLEGQIIDRTTLIAFDPNGINVYGNVTSTGALSGYIESNNFPVPVNGQILYLDFFTSLRYIASDFWNVDIDHFQAGYSSDEYFRFSGIADQDGAIFRNIVYSDSVGILKGNADFSWDTDFSYADLIINITDALEAGEHYYIYGVYDDKKINASASIAGMHVNRFLKQEQPMLLSAEITAAWDSINLFNAQANITSFYTYLSNTLLTAAVDINVSNDEILLSDLRIDYGVMTAQMPQLQINRASGIAKTSADIKAFAFERRLEGSLELDAVFNKIESWLYLGKAADTFNGSLLFTDVVFGESEYEKIAFNFSRDDKTLLFSGGLNNMIRLEMDKLGNFFLGLTAPFPIHGTVTGVFDNGNIDAFCNSFFIDLQQLYSLVAFPGEFNVAGGYITGMMEFKGPFWNPELNGTGIGSSMRFQVPGYIKEDLRPVPFMIYAEGHDMTFGPVVTAAGSGAGIISGYFLFENWIPIDIGLDINVSSDNPIPYDFEVSGFLAKGYASGNINVNFLMKEHIEVTGNLYSNDAELGLNIENIQGFLENGSALPITNQNKFLHSIIDMTITTGPIVEFTWPSSSPIIRVNPEMGTVIKVYSDSRAGQFMLDSNVNIRSGEIYYFDRSFYIRQGHIVFTESENKFDPLISARAEIRDRSDKGTVTISMVVENQPLLRFEPRFESSPNLTQLEIYSILGQNLNSYQGIESTDMATRFLLASTTDILTQIIASSSALSQFTFFRQFERRVRDIFRLDMFSIRTRLLHNAVIYGVSNISDQSTVERSNIVGNYFDNTTVFIGKYIGRDMFIQGMLTMRYDSNNTSFGGLVFEPDIGIELQSPFLKIRWDFFPYHPENWWVSDNSITLTWSMSY